MDEKPAKKFDYQVKYSGLIFSILNLYFVHSLILIFIQDALRELEGDEKALEYLQQTLLSSAPSCKCVSFLCFS